MYQHILVPVENSAADETVIRHVTQLARHSGAHLTLIHVADGYVARNYKELNLAPSQEMCDLIAMATHGHWLIGDVFLGERHPERPASSENPGAPDSG